MKKTRMLLLALAILLAGLAGLLVASMAANFSQRAPVVVARTRLLAGTVLTEGDIEVREVHPANVPPNALSSPQQAVGRRVIAERLPGDILTADALGEAQTFRLEKDEVAIGVSVDRVTGLSGLLRPGDRVSVIGVIASAPANLPLAAPAPPASPPAEGTASAPAPESPLPYARIYLRGLRVLFIHHEFAYTPPRLAPAAAEGGLVPVSSAPARQAEGGVVVLAAPVTPQPITVYYGSESQTRFLSPAEVVALLNAVGKIHLALDPMERSDVEAYGVRLFELLPSPVLTQTQTAEQKEGGP